LNNKTLLNFFFSTHPEFVSPYLRTNDIYKVTYEEIKMIPSTPM